MVKQEDRIPVSVVKEQVEFLGIFDTKVTFEKWNRGLVRFVDVFNKEYEKVVGDSKGYDAR